jgi:hypothetical protein
MFLGGTNFIGSVFKNFTAPNKKLPDLFEFFIWLTCMWSESLREKQLNRMVEQFKPDLILFSGDILNLSYLKDDLAWRSAVKSCKTGKPIRHLSVTAARRRFGRKLPKIIEGLPLTWWMTRQWN